jgi:hypothetical protein
MTQRRGSGALECGGLTPPWNQTGIRQKKAVARATAVQGGPGVLDRSPGFAGGYLLVYGRVDLLAACLQNRPEIEIPTPG